MGTVSVLTVEAVVTMSGSMVAGHTSPLVSVVGVCALLARNASWCSHVLPLFLGLAFSDFGGVVGGFSDYVDQCSSRGA